MRADAIGEIFVGGHPADGRQAFAGMDRRDPREGAGIGHMRPEGDRIEPVSYTHLPRTGRFFRPDECAAVGKAPVAVIAEELWRDRFGGDKQIVGRRINIDDQPFTVVGVVPAGSAAKANGTEVWIPYTAQPYLDPGFDPFGKMTSWLWLDGRLAPGMSRSAAQAELTVLARQLDSQHPGRVTTLYVTDGSFLEQQPIMNLSLIHI